MPIQYRCRCGQEVVLRPREGMYFLVGGALLLTAFNTVLMILLWVRTAEKPESDRPPTVTAGPADSNALDPPDSNVHSTTGGTSIAGPEAVDRTMPVGVARENEGSASTKGALGETLSSGSPVADARSPETSTTGDPNVSSVGTESPTVEVTKTPDEPDPVDQSRPKPLAIARPGEADAFALALGLSDLPSGPADRAAILLAGHAWGSGQLREKASRLIDQESGRFGPSLRAWRDTRSTERDGDSDEIQVLDDLLPSRDRDALAAAAERLSQLLTAAGSPDDRAWSDRFRALPATERDVVFLVDLSESMTSEVQATVQSLRVLLPLLDAPDRTRRWGWIGFRDEVVETEPLTDDVDRFLESTLRWKCEAGGDVPEGVDRAVFEALRFGSLEWRPGATRQLVLLGDAPPPYDRIRGCASLLEAAHNSPEKYNLSALGVLREAEFDEVPAFRKFARAGGGIARFVRAGAELTGDWWDLLAGAGAPRWSRGPFRQRL